MPEYRKYYGIYNTQDSGPSSACGGAAPINNFLGSYVPQQYYVPDCPSSMIYRRGNSSICAQEVAACGSNAQGLNSNSLMPEGMHLGIGDNFKSFLISPPRDVLAADRLDNDNYVLSVTRGQSRDLRGDIPLGVTSPPCGYGNCYDMNPNTGIVGWKPWNANTVPWAINQGTNTKNDFNITNKVQRTFIY